MKNLILCLSLISSSMLYAQKLKLPVDTQIVTNHSITVKGEPVNYEAITGTQPVWNKEGNPVASLYYTYYHRTGVKNAEQRPLIFSFNGGPGSAAVWMHLAYTGPKILNIDEEGYPVQPYGYKDNPYSILDVADIVYVNPVNTGYSRMIPDKEGKMPDQKMFFGVNADIEYLAEWMNTFVSRKNRWVSPKYIIGESYGGTRVMGLAAKLQDAQWMYLNGVIMVSPADYKVIRKDNPVSHALYLPYYTATAWHHKLLSEDLQSKDLLEVLPEVEDFCINELIPALAMGGFLEEEKRNAIASKMAKYTSLSQEFILQNNLRVPNRFFWKELMRKEKGLTIGRLDSRYLGIDKSEAGDSPEYSPELNSWLHSFTPAINHYIRNELKFETDLKYHLLGSVGRWDYRNDNVRDGLRSAMASNPYLHVMVQSGYYDGATTYFNGKYTLWQLDPSGKLKDRMSFKGYRSGHMMYLRKDDLIQANDDLREFIKQSSAKGKAAKY